MSLLGGSGRGRGAAGARFEDVELHEGPDGRAERRPGGERHNAVAQR